MNLESTIRSKTTQEKGFALVNAKGKRVAEFPVDGGNSFTSDIEILRGELAKIFFDVVKDDIEYLFGDHVTAIDDNERNEKVKVTLASGKQRDFDLVIGADGMSSKTRRLAFPPGNPLKSLGQYTAYFTIPYKESKGQFAEWYNAPGRRNILLRPDNAGYTRAYLSVMNPAAAGFAKLDVEGQKKMMRDYFKDAGWEAERALDGMDKAEDFYMQEIAQVKLDSFSSGRVALVGDAGYCPSPISGMGNSLAIMGAYILAGELAACKGNWKEGLRMYEVKMRPIVEKAQSLPPGAPGLVNPETKWGIRIMGGIAWAISSSGITKLIGKLSSPPTEDQSLPVYEF